MDKNKKRAASFKNQFRLDPLDRDHLRLEVLTTDKTASMLAREFGVSKATICYYRRQLRVALYRERMRRGDPFLSYNKDGKPRFNAK